MAKLTNVKERVQQPFRDALIRTSGLAAGTLSGQDQLFQSNNNQKTIGETNLRNGSTLPSDQSMIILALRVFLLFRNVAYRTLSAAAVPAVTITGEILQFPNNTNTDGFNSQLAFTRDVMRMYEYAGSQIFWTFGAGEKPSISLMPTVYFPYGGGLVSDIGASSDFIHVNNGLQTHGSMLKLARAILLVPRQQIQCTAQMQAIPTAGQATVYSTTQGSRDMYSVKDALNALDGMQKEITFTFDGLLSRDVQLPSRRRPTPPRSNKAPAIARCTSGAGGGLVSFPHMRPAPSPGARHPLPGRPDRWNSNSGPLKSAPNSATPNAPSPAFSARTPACASSTPR